MVQDQSATVASMIQILGMSALNLVDSGMLDIMSAVDSIGLPVKVTLAAGFECDPSAQCGRWNALTML